MFSTKQKQRADGAANSLNNRNFVPIGRNVQETVMAKGSDKAWSPLAGPDPAVDQPWDDIVFENRNRDYGAYVLRRGYSLNVVIGLAVTIVVVMCLLFYPLLTRLFGDGELTAHAAPRKLVYSELSLPPPIDRPKPIPPSIQLPKLKSVVKFVPPKVVKEDVVEIPPTLEDIKENDIGAVAAEGPADVVFDEPVEEVVGDDDELFTVVDQQPEFEGGYDAMMAFIQQNMKYPPNARRMQIEGTVHVSFIVSKNGTISEVKVLRGIMTECDREAVRVVQMMPAWRPGKQNGRNVNVRFILPLKFRIN